MKGFGALPRVSLASDSQVNHARIRHYRRAGVFSPQPILQIRTDHGEKMNVTEG
jgi:hypothetical protein